MILLIYESAFKKLYNEKYGTRVSSAWIICGRKCVGWTIIVWNKIKVSTDLNYNYVAKEKYSFVMKAVTEGDTCP